MRKKRMQNATINEKKHALRLLDKNGNNISQTAKILNISYNTLYAWNKENVKTDGSVDDSWHKSVSATIDRKQHLSVNQEEMHKQFVSDIIELKEYAILILRSKLNQNPNIKEINDTIKLLHLISPHPIEDEKTDSRPARNSEFIRQLYKDYPQQKTE